MKRREVKAYELITQTLPDGSKIVRSTKAPPSRPPKCCLCGSQLGEGIKHGTCEECQKQPTPKGGE